MAPSGKPNADAALHRLDRAAVVQSWVQALRDGANAAQLRAMAPLTDSEAAQVMALMRSAAPAATHSGGAASPDVALDVAPGQFRPRLTLMTLGRGDGLLGMQPQGKLGPRGDSVTLVQIDWTYRTDSGATWHTPAPTSILGARPAPVQELFDTGGPVLRMQRNLAAEADAMDRVWDLRVSRDKASFDS
ncbi:MAG: hypothetical protein ACK4LR_04225 [Acidovorax temperans]|uniref:hypothetical protein n=1 Tax=Acidovorax temperans TaxID=80878 RepID=UPI00391DED62